jgi:rhodanese-related sulfurtransferase
VAQRRRHPVSGGRTSSAGSGAACLLVDVRDAEELVGPQGHIPGSQWVPLERIAELPERYPEGTPVVLISRNGGPRAAEAARALECAGMGFVAVMDGGDDGVEEARLRDGARRGGAEREPAPRRHLSLRTARRDR